MPPRRLGAIPAVAAWGSPSRDAAHDFQIVAMVLGTFGMFERELSVERSLSLESAAKVAAALGLVLVPRR